MNIAPRKAVVWLSRLTLLLLLFVLLAVPVAWRIVNGVGRVISAILEGAVSTLAATHAVQAAASEHVLASIEAKALLGEPLATASFEDTTWMPSPGPDTLIFEFPVTGAVAEGVARVEVRFDAGVIRSMHITLTMPDGTCHELSAP